MKKGVETKGKEAKENKKGQKEEMKGGTLNCGQKEDEYRFLSLTMTLQNIWR